MKRNAENGLFPKPSFMTYKASVIRTPFFMARSAVIHLHSVPGVLLEANNI